MSADLITEFLVESTENLDRLDRDLVELEKDHRSNQGSTHSPVRNSVDHGIETPQIRVRAGKSSEGVIHLRAFHGGGQIHLEVSDDGAGIDPTRVREKAIQRGLITTDHASRMSDSDMVRLAFLPGLSTAEKLSTISGRGVGMDVVRTTIERIGGHVDIRSRIGEGTVIEIRIPMARSKRVLADTA